MSQRKRARRRLRRQLLEQVPAPLLYPCVRADFVCRNLPPDVLPPLTAATCSCCSVPVLASTPAYWSMQALAQRSQRELAVLCLECGEEVTRGAAYTEIRFPDPQLAARLNQWESMKN